MNNSVQKEINDFMMKEREAKANNPVTRFKKLRKLAERRLLCRIVKKINWN